MMNLRIYLLVYIPGRYLLGISKYIFSHHRLFRHPEQIESNCHIIFVKLAM